MSAEKFMALVEELKGFEFTQAYRDDEDRLIGGKGDTFWYTVAKKGRIAESFVATVKDGEWQDTHIKVKGRKKTEETVEPGTTMGLIVENAYRGQEEKWVKGRKGSLIEDAHPHLHYTFGFGDKALDVSCEYGVTIGFSNLNDESAGFHLRGAYTGSQVETP